MMAGLEKEFEPRGDMPAIQEILEVKDLLNHVQNLKQVYTQTRTRSYTCAHTQVHVHTDTDGTAQIPGTGTPD